MGDCVRIDHLPAAPAQDFRQRRLAAGDAAGQADVLASRSLRPLYSFATCTERMPGSASISLITSAAGALSRFRMLRAVPPLAPRLSDMLAMLILCLASSVPIQPTMPGQSLFSTIISTPSGAASTLWTVQAHQPRPAAEDGRGHLVGPLALARLDRDQVGEIAALRALRFGHLDAEVSAPRAGALTALTATSEACASSPFSTARVTGMVPPPRRPCRCNG